ncbi:MAG: tetratricopeptide repeat protein [Chloroflexota bacterium]|nr:tetratricopeptide repeat protein [Chloroflexota bacterium]
MATQDILLLISLGIIVLWTWRLARAKGLNPWYWGVGTALLVVVAWMFSRQYLAPVVMAPLIFLLLFRSPLFRRNRQPESTPCPSCGAPDTGGLNFCVQCGWDLSHASAERSESEPEAPIARDQQDEQVDEVQQQHPPTAEPWAPASSTEEQREEAPDTVSPPAPVVQPEPEPVLAQEAAPNPVQEEAPTQPAPPPRERRPIPTPANLTARGIELFNEGRYQESIDQFTKAIALDSNYREAWERRAEAYGRLGRPERQQADQSRLEAF